jgi:glycosyltransferase involved in cell wall biosynthesis
MSAMPISVAIIAKDEARHIAAAIASVHGHVAEVVVLVDQRSVDATATIAAEAGARVLIEAWRGFPGQRNLALARCTQPWVFFLDADERVEPDLLAELAAHCVDAPADVAGYWVPRHNYFFGRCLVGGGWYPDYQLRLVRRLDAHYDEHIEVHEVAAVRGTTVHLTGHITHLNIERFDELWHKQAVYARREAATMYQQRRPVRWRNYIGAPVREFVYRYLTNAGWRDGWVGLVLASVMAWFAMVSFVELNRLYRSTKGSSHD